MSSKKKLRKGPIVTRGRLSRWQREKRLRRITIIAGCVIVAIVLAVCGYGYYDSAIAPYHQTILKVGDATFDTGYYIELLRLGGIRNADNSSQQQYIAQYTLESIKRNEILRQLASDLGITVSKKEVEKEIQEQFSPSEEAGQNPGETQQSISYEEYIQKLEEIGVSEEVFREQISASLLENKLREHIGEEKVPEEMTQVHVRGIMLEDEENLKEVQERLDAGEDFSELAKEFSKAPSSKDGGDLGWMPRKIMALQYPEQVVNTAFSLRVGEVSDPIETELQAGSSEDTNRYWVVKVLGRKKRPLEESERQMLQNQAFSQWFSKQREKFNIEEHLSPELKEWAIAKAVG